ncbi:putative diphthamide synthesis protein-domain-containing protein [Kalaharituber pfeilii]|nr:putative diphthamide synthesis protein-domain-containing protein [Kalaharituber pfeilii]
MTTPEGLSSLPTAPLLSSATTAAPILDSSAFSTYELPPSLQMSPRKPDAQISSIYEIPRTVSEILDGGFVRVALQFPDELLPDAARVAELLLAGINSTVREKEEEEMERKVYVLADTSYGSCCVDEVAAQHVCADVIVHYGRACLSLTERIPVIYVYTVSPLHVAGVVGAFHAQFGMGKEGRGRKVMVMGDLRYQAYLGEIVERVRDQDGGWEGEVWLGEVVKDPASLVPNRTVPMECRDEGANKFREEWEIFHVGTPMQSLLLVLVSRVKQIWVYPAEKLENHSTITADEIIAADPPTALLRRRYATLMRLRAASIIGILVSTLSIKHYRDVVFLVRRLIASHGKKSYTVVVGKVNPAKLANFAEIEAWVGVGCWEQGVVGGVLDSGGGEFWRPVVTVWELGVGLGGGTGRRWEWNGEWIVDFETLLGLDRPDKMTPEALITKEKAEQDTHDPQNPLSALPESLPPDFDLRTGRYVFSRPLVTSHPATSTVTATVTNTLALSSAPSAPLPSSSTALTTSQHAGSLAITNSASAVSRIVAVGGVVSPAAEFLKEGRSWAGLVVGGDLGGQEGEEEGATLRVGRKGVARGYAVGEEIGRA